MDAEFAAGRRGVCRASRPRWPKSGRRRWTRPARSSRRCGPAAVQRHNSELRDLEDRYNRRLAELDALCQNESRGLDEGFDRTMADREARFQQDWQAAASRWLAGMQQVQSAVDEMNRTGDRLFPPWDAPTWDRWTAAAAMPATIPFGRLDLKLGDMEGGMPEDRRLVPPRTEFSIPVSLGLRDHSLLVAEGRRRRPRGGRPVPSDDDAPHVDGHPAGQGAIPDRRSDRPGRALLRLHAPGRLQRATDLQPHLDGERPRRAASGRVDRAHGERDPGLLAQRVSVGPRIQRIGRRAGRAVSGARGGQLPRRVHRDGRPAAAEHRGQRGPLRRLHAVVARHPAADPPRLPPGRPGAARREAHLERRAVPLAASRVAARCR